MNKQEFILMLREKLSGLNTKDIEERINFYSEIIDDRIEEGFSEEEAVLAVGNINEVVSEIISDIPFTKIATERIKPKRRLKTMEIILLVLGSPIWLSLIIVAVTVVLSIYLSLWAIIISLWAVFASLIGGALGGIASGVIIGLLLDNLLSGVALIATALVCGGLSVFVFYGCKATTKGILLLTHKLTLWIKNCFIRKGETQ